MATAGRRASRRRPGRGAGAVLRSLALAGIVAALLLTCIVVGWQSWLPVLFVVYLPLLVLIYRHGFTGVVSGSIVLAVAGGISAAYDLGSFAMIPDADVAKRALLLQLFVGVGCLLSYPLAVGLSERRRMMRELAASEARVRASEAQLHAVADNLPAMIAHFDGEARFTYANRTARRVLGLDGDALIGTRLLDLRGAGPVDELAAHARAVLAGERHAFEGHAELAGRTFDHRTQLVPDVDDDGAVRGFYSLTFDITALKAAERELAQLARVDALTGLANRRHFEERLPEALARAQRGGRPLTLLLLDLDRFKAINDTHGHAMGDAVLKAFAERIAQCVYEVDLPARLGGDEFVVLLEGDTDADTAARVAQRIVVAVREPLVIEGVALALTTSIGVGVHFPARDAATVLRLADDAVYAAKAAGRDGWRVRTG